MKLKHNVVGSVRTQRGAQALLPCSTRTTIGVRRSLALWTGLIVGMALAGTLNPSSVFGSLGGDVTSVEADRGKMEATMQTTSTQLYTVHEMHTTNNVTVREFVSPTGKVFGVAWQGASRPDMKQLLGAYFDQYTQGVQKQKAKPVGRAPLLIEQPGFVLQMSGHMRALAGRAYIPQLVPAGMQIEELR
jgi:Protein of unknown function (DUF2844)